MAIITVGSGKQYSRIADAVKAAKDGDVVQVDAGTYYDDFPVVNTKISIVGVGGMAKLVATKPVYKGIIEANNDLTVEHLEFSGAANGDLNGCGIRYQAGNLVVKNSYFHDNQMNLLGNPSSGTMLVDNCEFGKTLPTSGFSHSLYIGHMAKAVITDSYFHDTTTGQHIKSRADYTLIENNRMVDGTGDSSYAVDLPNGGVGIVRGNVMVQKAGASNLSIIHFGGEGTPYANSSLRVEKNVIINETTSGGTGLLNHTSTVADFVGNSLYQVRTVVNGPANISGSVVLTTKPAVSTVSPIEPATTAPAPAPEPAPAPAPEPAPTPAPTTKTIYGTSGNDTLSGAGGEVTMEGKTGNDTYIVDSAGDVVRETSSAGVDTVKSSVSFTLGAYVENLDLTGLNAIDGTGNTHNNTIRGNGAANDLVGLSGTDTLYGNGGDDLLLGGAGRDNLTGGAGADIFGFVSKSDGTTVSQNGLKGWTSGDRITDFQSGVDKIGLEAGGFGLKAGAPTLGVNLVMLNTAYDGTNASATDYNAKKACVIVDSTGSVYVDTNGKDAGYTLLASVQTGATIKATDIAVYYDLG